MATPDFPNAPEAGKEFRHAQQPEQPAAPKERAERSSPELDHLDLASLDYTPGGALEYSVHKELSDNGRREYQERMQRTEPRDERHYLDQVQDGLDDQFKAAAKERVGEPSQKSSPVERHQRGAGKEEQQPRRAPDYDMPKSEEHSAARDRSEDAGSDARPHGRPPRTSRGSRDRSHDGHER